MYGLVISQKVAFPPDIKNPADWKAFAGDRKGFRLPVSQQKSFLMLQAFIGCPWGCVYCCRSKKDIVMPLRVADDEVVVQALLAHPFFIRDRSPLAVNSDSTDPFLPQVKESTFAILTLLNAAGIRNPVSLFTKSPLSREDIERLRSYTNLDIDISVSYTAMPQEYEPASAEARIQLMRDLVAAGIKVSIFQRPLIPTWNDTDECFRQVLQVAQETGVGSIIAGGFKYGESIRQAIMDRGFTPPPSELWGAKKYLSRDVLPRLMAAYEELGLLFRC